MARWWLIVLLATLAAAWWGSDPGGYPPAYRGLRWLGDDRGAWILLGPLVLTAAGITARRWGWGRAGPYSVLLTALLAAALPLPGVGELLGAGGQIALLLLALLAALLLAPFAAGG